MQSETFIEPWNGTLSDRLSVLAEADWRVLYFYEEPDSASFRYRCYNMAQTINDTPDYTKAAYIFLSDLEALGTPSDYADVLVVCRTRYDSHVERLIESFKGSGKKVFFDIDDLIFDTSYTSLVASNLNFDLWGEGLDKWFSLISRMGATMKLCDEVITTNSYLSELAGAFSGLPTHVIPNFLNKEQLHVSQALVSQKKDKPSRNDSLRLGYFSGSKSHTKDFDVIVEDLAQTMTTFPEVELFIVGHLDVPNALAPYKERIVYRNFTDFVSLQSLIADVDLCLAPLQQSSFTYSKSQLKFFEAGAVDVPTMATPTPVFKEAIEHGSNGFLAEPGTWHHHIELFSSSPAKERAHIGKQARTDALERFSPGAHRDRIVKTLRSH